MFFRFCVQYFLLALPIDSSLVCNLFRCLPCCYCGREFESGDRAEVLPPSYITWIHRYYALPLSPEPGSQGIVLPPASITWLPRPCAAPCLNHLAPKTLCCPLPQSPGSRDLLLPPASITWLLRSCAAPCLNHLAPEILCCPLPQSPGF